MRKKAILYFIIYTINTMGTWIRFVITPLFIYKVTGSFINSGISSILSYLTQLVVVPLISPFINNLNKEKVASISSLLQCILVITYTTTGSLYIIYIISMGLSVLSQISTSSCTIIVKKWVKPSELKEVNSILTTISNIFVCIGPMLGGILAAKYGFYVCFYIDAISYFIYSVILFFAKEEDTQSAQNLTTDNNHNKQLLGFEKYIEAINYLRIRKRLIIYITSTVFLWLGVECLLLLYPILCNDLNSSPNSYGIFWSVIGVGQLIGGVLVIKFKKHDTFSLYYQSILLSGIFHIFLFAVHQYLLALITIFIATLGDGISIVLDDCIVQEEIDTNIMLIFLTCLQAVISISSLIGSSLAVLLLNYINYRIIGTIAGIFLIISSIIGLSGLRETKIIEYQ